MKRRGVQPNILTYTSLARAQGDLEKATNWVLHSGMLRAPTDHPKPKGRQSVVCSRPRWFSGPICVVEDKAAATFCVSIPAGWGTLVSQKTCSLCRAWRGGPKSEPILSGNCGRWDKVEELAREMRANYGACDFRGMGAFVVILVVVVVVVAAFVVVVVLVLLEILGFLVLDVIHVAVLVIVLEF